MSCGLGGAVAARSGGESPVKVCGSVVSGQGGLSSEGWFILHASRRHKILAVFVTMRSTR